MGYEISGPTMPDLKNRVGANYEEIGRVLMAQNAAFLISSFLGGFITDRWKKHVILVTVGAQILLVIGAALTPWCRALWQLGLVMFVQGMGLGSIATSKSK